MQEIEIYCSTQTASSCFYLRVVTDKCQRIHKNSYALDTAAEIITDYRYLSENDMDSSCIFAEYHKQTFTDTTIDGMF